MGPPCSRSATLDVDVDPLMVVGGVGEALDARLVEAEPVGHAQVSTCHFWQVGKGDDDGSAHALAAFGSRVNLLGPAKPNIQAPILRIWISSAPSVIR